MSVWSQEPAMVDRSAYRTILDWSVHSTVQPDDFNTLSNSQRTMTKIKRLASQKMPPNPAKKPAASSPYVSEWSYGSQRSKSDEDPPGKSPDNKSTRQTKFDPIQEGYSERRSSAGSRGWIPKDKDEASYVKQLESFRVSSIENLSGRSDEYDDDEYSERNSKHNRSNIRESRKGTRFDRQDDDRYLESDSTPYRSKDRDSGRGAGFSRSDNYEERSESDFNTRNYDYAYQDPRKQVLQNPRGSIRKDRDNEYLFSPQLVLPAIQAMVRELRVIYYSEDDQYWPIDNNFHLPLVSDCLEAAKKAHIKTVKVNQWELDQLAPGNMGIVMEARPIKMNIVSAIGKVEYSGRYPLLPEKKGRQSILCHRSCGPIPPRSGQRYQKSQPRNPVWVFIERAESSRVLGELIKTAYYMGADGVFIRRSMCPPLGIEVSLASGGAAEQREIFQIKNMPKFVRSTKKNGWTIIGLHRTLGTEKTLFMQDCQGDGVDSPTLLVVNGDGDTITRNLRPVCNSYFEIPSLCKYPDHPGIGMGSDVALGLALSAMVNQ
ncbi:hypothetical protein BGZ76_009241 [Entomortierella beljakovae]|nr:hypothetical protein BGZ76_009241 [Entomortierella beljakovae]